MQRVIAASVRCYGLAAPGARLARGKAAGSRGMATSPQAVMSWCGPANVGASAMRMQASNVGVPRIASARRAVRVARAISTDAPASAHAASAAKGSGASATVPTFQEAILRLQQYWADRGCALWLPHNTEVGAGTMNPATFLRSLGPEPWSVCYPEPSIRPDDSRYGDNPNRVQRHTQFQVILKPDPGNAQELYLGSLEALGIDTKAHDLRFVEDNWESPVLGAWGLGWEVWLDGMEVTQFTYFQQCGGIDCKPVSIEITYGLERLAMYLQDVESIWDLSWNSERSYGEIWLPFEKGQCNFNFEASNPERLNQLFAIYEAEAADLIEKQLPAPALDFVLKCSHTFNLLEARGVISVTERTATIGRIRNLARKVAEAWLAEREALGFPLLKGGTLDTAA